MKINGVYKKLECSITLSELVEAEQYPISRIAVELNGQIVPKGDYASTILTEADTLEIVCFVGGG